MKIHIRDGKTFRLRLPNRLVCSRFVLKKAGLPITAKQARLLRTTIREFRRTHPEWVLVEVESADGQFVQVKC